MSQEIEDKQKARQTERSLIRESEVGLLDTLHVPETPQISVDTDGGVAFRPRIIVSQSDLPSVYQGIRLGKPNIVGTTIRSDGSTSSHRSPNLEGSIPGSDRPSEGSVIPQAIPYQLNLTFDGSGVPDMGENRLLLLNDANNYQELEKIAEDLVKDHHAIEPARGQLLFLRGDCTIISDNEGQKTMGLTSLEDWKDICVVLTNLLASNTHNNLCLKISRDYFAPKSKNLTHDSIATETRLEIDSLMKDSFNGRRYIPRPDLERIISSDIIRKIILEEPPQDTTSSELEAFIAKVQRTARNLLAQCVLAALGMDCLKTLMDKGWNDTIFPLEIQHRCHKKCSPAFRNLLTDQGGFRPAEFFEVGQHQKLSLQIVVPIEFHHNDSPIKEEKENDSEKESKKPDQEDNPAKRNAWCGSGAYSNVYRVRINRYQHRLPNSSEVFALKEFKDRPQRADSDFQKELKILDELRKYPQDHIVTHLATWEQDGKYYMLFPYAQCNLRQYMRRIPFNKESKETTLWLQEQLRGLALALRNIHDLSAGNNSASAPNLNPPAPEMRKSGWHHDLKPENILFFTCFGNQNGEFRIADFGSGKVHSYRSGSINTRSPNGTLTYEPPEAKSEGATSRPYDMWSLGCVFLELLVWAVFDFQSVKNFAQDRIERRYPGSQTDLVEDDGFWQMAENGEVTLRKGVTDWIQRLREETVRQDRQPFKEVLDLILLMLNPRRKSRIRALDLWDTLYRICIQKKVDMECTMDDSLEIDSLPRLSLYAPEPRTQPSAEAPEPSPPLDASGSLPRVSLSPASGNSGHAFFEPPPRTDQEPRQNSSASESRLSPGVRVHKRDISKVSFWSTDVQGGYSVHSQAPSTDLNEGV